MPFSVSPSLARKLAANVGSTEELPQSDAEKPVKARKPRVSTGIMPEAARGQWLEGKHFYRAISSHLWETKCHKWTSREPVGSVVTCGMCKKEA